MADGVDVRGVDILRQLDGDLRRFALHVQAVAEIADQEIRRALATLAERKAEQEWAVRRCEEALKEARDGLAAAEDGGDGGGDGGGGDGHGDTGQLLLAVHAAEAELAEAEAGLAEIRRRQAEVEEAAAAFRRRELELLDLAGDHTGRASTFLQDRYENLVDYVQTGPAAGGGPLVAPGARAGPPGPAGVQTQGTPDTDRRWRRYQTRGTCATVAQQMVLLKHTDRDFGEEALAAEAYAAGWTSKGGGTPPEFLGELLQAHGVPVKKWGFDAAGLATLQAELVQHHDVIVAVDAGELYREGDEGGHALWVTGLRLENGRPVRVCVCDSNQYTYPDGVHAAPAPEEYEIDHFLAAWGAYGYRMISTENAAPPGGV